MRQIIPLNRDWEFTENVTEGFIKGDPADAVRVCLPHTVKETPLSYFDENEYQTVSCYRRRISRPQGSEDKRVILHIGAAGHYAEVFLDGERIASHKGGYTEFTADLSDRLGENSLLCVQVDSRESLNIPPFGHVIDYMTYGGLYREVWLEVTERQHIADVFAVPSIPDEALSGTHESISAEEIGAITFDGTIRCQLTIEEIGELTVRQYVYLAGDPERTILAQKSFVKGDVCELTVPGARLWDIASPTLYTLVTELTYGETVVDRAATRIGFRRSEFKADGYYLNGRRILLRGLNRHQSFPYVGYAMPRSMQRYDAEILKRELGLNAVRTSHYPQSHHFIDRCDELGLLVFTETPGWQHIGDEEWKDTAVETTGEMVRQYRNHPSVILWGVRINESQDDDAFYTRTNKTAHELDPTRPTGGVRYIKKSHLLEDVYTYNDFSHDGRAPGCEPKKAVTPDMKKPYLISEYCGHMFPTKAYDCEEHNVELALRHARILNAVRGYEGEICGAFGWCFFDYNTHRDFGSGDRICYHGVCDMFRNPKLVGAVYASQQEETPVLAVSSSMDIGEHPASVRGKVYAFTNADSVRFYKNGEFICEYPAGSEEFSAMLHPPIEINDYIGDRIEKGENFGKTQAAYTKDVLNESAIRGMNYLTPKTKLKAAYLAARHGMDYEAAYNLYGKYIANWGDSAAVFRFEAVKNGEVVKVAEKSPFLSRRVEIKVSHTDLIEGDTYDVAAVRIRMTDQNDNTLTFFHSTAAVEVSGPIALIGPENAPLIGGMGGLYVRTTGEPGEAALTIRIEGCEEQVIRFRILNKSEE